MRKFRVMLASLALAFCGLFAAAAPASAADLSVNMNSACQYQYGAAHSAYLAVHNVLGWRCSPGGGQHQRPELVQGGLRTKCNFGLVQLQRPVLLAVPGLGRLHSLVLA